LGEKTTGKDGVTNICKTADGKAVFLSYGDQVLTYCPTKVGVPSYYPITPAPMPKTIKAVLMDLDGTSVHSEIFWIWVIEQVTCTLLNDPKFKFADEDIPHVSGRSVSEHLKYCIDKYCKNTVSATMEKAWKTYFDITHSELDNILKGRPTKAPTTFQPAPFLKEFIFGLREKGVKIGLVTSGLYEKSIPEIKAAFDTLNIGDPVKFYDAIVTAGFSIQPGAPGTLGELQAKPHPWPYSECLFALGVKKEESVGIEDSGSGIISIRLAGIAAIGVDGGNIISGGEKPLCAQFHSTIKDIWDNMKF
jgi:beta-phosphoglucomutase-like phosphatase (HAD superfamily)